MINEKKPVFSFMMSVYKDVSLFERAINSLRMQSYEDWELIILDNGNKDMVVWELIQRAAHADERIKAYKIDENVGWPKGAAICLEYVTGEYTTFLAADDVICEGALETLAETIEAQRPDVIWVGNELAEYDKNTQQLVVVEKGIPHYAVYEKEKRSVAVVNIMKDVYYNSLFHYMCVNFLKKNRIDFFEPYYEDCVGMTKAMVVAEKMVVLDSSVYSLTKNTSQTAGRYIWDSYQFVFAKQWEILKELFLKEDYKDINVCYVAKRILNNLMGNIGGLCRGICRDKYMQPLQKSKEEIIKQLEDILGDEKIQEMLLLAGEEESMKILLQELIHLKAEDVEVFVEFSWLKPLFLLSWNEECSMYEKAHLLCDWILEKNNLYGMGFEYMVKYLEQIPENVLVLLRENLRMVMEKYQKVRNWVETEYWMGQIIS